MPEPLSKLLDLECLDLNLFRSQYHQENHRKILFGGQVLGQALIAASRTVEGRLAHSLHAYFLRAGSSDTPVIYDVDPIRDGGSFTTRRVLARQQGRPIFNLSASFHKDEPGYQHQMNFCGDVPKPEDCCDETELAEKMGIQLHHRAKNSAFFHMRPTDPALWMGDNVNEPKHTFWIKAPHSLPENPVIHQCALAFASDIGLLMTATLPHPISVFDPSLMIATLDHAIWFHSSNFRADEWLLYVTDSPWAGGARGLTRGSVYTREGVLVASTSQEGLIRPIKTSPLQQ